VTVTERPAGAMQSLHGRLAAIYETDRSSRRVPAMEGLRGLAILLVFFCHYDLVVLNRLGPIFNDTFFHTVVQVGGTGVDLFFLLSGMLIYRAALRRDLHLGRFLTRRVQRIYPTFLVAFAIYFLVSVVLHQGEQRVPGNLSGALGYVAENIFLLPGLADMKPLIPAAWSLSYEFFFYLAAPMLVWALRMAHWPRRRRCIFWIALLALHISYVVALSNTLPVYHYQSNSFIRFGMFIAGILVLEMLESARGAAWLTPARQRLLAGAGALCAAVYLRFLYLNVDNMHPPVSHEAIGQLAVFWIYACLALATLGERGVLQRLFSVAWLRWTGNISYSLYLIHGIVLNALIAACLHVPGVVTHPAVAAAICLPLFFAVVYAVATMLFLLVEKPFSLQPPARRKTVDMEQVSSTA
jgi:exopolysaccharide production protein ExoZ